VIFRQIMVILGKNICKQMKMVRKLILESVEPQLVLYCIVLYCISIQSLAIVRIDGLVLVYCITGMKVGGNLTKRNTESP